MSNEFSRFPTKKNRLQTFLFSLATYIKFFPSSQKIAPQLRRVVKIFFKNIDLLRSAEVEKKNQRKSWKQESIQIWKIV